MSLYKVFMPVLFISILLVDLSCSAAGTGNAAGDLPLLASIPSENAEVMKSVSLGGNLLFTSSEYKGMTMMDASDISNISKIGTNFNYPTFHPVNDVFVLEDFVFLALGNNSETGGISVIDKSDTNAVVLNSISSNNANANSKAIYVTGSGSSYVAYVADENLGLRVYSINTGTGAIAVVATVSLPGGQAVDITVSGTTAYIAGKNSGVYVVTDITGARTVSAQISTEISDARGVAVSGAGDTLFIADRMLGIWAYDVSTPSKPTIVGNYATPGEAYGIVANGDDVYVADGSNGILWIDFTTPSSPELLKQDSSKLGIVWDIVLVDSFIVGAYGPDGIKVFAK